MLFFILFQRNCLVKSTTICYTILSTIDVIFLFCIIINHLNKNFDFLVSLTSLQASWFDKIFRELESNMALNPQYEQIGKAFTEQYYNIFDNAATR